MTLRTASPLPWKFIGRDERNTDVPTFSIVDARGKVIGSVKYGWDGEAIVAAVNATVEPAPPEPEPASEAPPAERTTEAM